MPDALDAAPPPEAEAPPTAAAPNDGDEMEGESSAHAMEHFNLIPRCVPCSLPRARCASA